MTNSNSHSTPSRSELVDELCEQLDFTDAVCKMSKNIYQMVYDNNAYHGRTTELVLGGTVYVACRALNAPVNPRRIADELDLTRDELLATARHLMKSLDIPLRPASPGPFISEYRRALGFSETVEEKAFEIFHICKKDGMHSGKSPSGFAAGAVYAASKLVDEPITQAELSEVSNVSEVTIRNRYKAQMEMYRAAQAE
jgi:transcription initiation factor TFIIB